MKHIYLGLIMVLLLSIVGVWALTDEVSNTYITQERMSPKDRISQDQISVYKDRVVLDIENPSWAKFTDTNSMDPFIDAGANSIEIKPKSAADISTGDVISYYHGEDLIVHRVILVGEDSEGIFYIVKGDNNSRPDPEKVRFEQVNGILVAVIY